MTDFKSYFLVLLLKASAYLPLILSRTIGTCVGYFVYLSGGKMMKVTRTNIQLCFPELSEDEQQKLVRQSLIETGKAMLETGAVWMRDYAWLKRRIVAVEGLGLLEDMVKQPAGTILLVPHLGNWEVMGLYLTEISEVTSLYQPPDIAVLEPIIRAAREKLGAVLVPTNRQGVATLLKSLKGGGLTAILPDQVPEHSGGSYASFFGVTALTMTLVHNLVKRTGAQVLAGFAERVPGGFRIVFRHAEPGIGDDDVERSLIALNLTVEACVRQSPAQYQWEYKRFKRQPFDMAKVYRHCK